MCVNVCGCVNVFGGVNVLEMNVQRKREMREKKKRERERERRNTQHSKAQAHPVWHVADRATSIGVLDLHVANGHARRVDSKDPTELFDKHIGRVGDIDGDRTARRVL